MTEPAFVHVIAIVDLTHVSGDIKYVVPVARPASAAEPVAAARGRVQLLVRGAAGAELERVPIAVCIASCSSVADGAERIEGGLVQHTLRLPDGAAGFDLMIDGRRVDSFDAPPDEEPAAPSLDLARATLAAAGPMLDIEVPPSPHRKALTGGEVMPEAGTSYTVQVKPTAATAWTTLSVGRPTPAFNLDRNQFSGASEVDVRIIRNRGFRSNLHLERRISLLDDLFIGDPVQPA
jgi:hypothetical protein